MLKPLHRIYLLLFILALLMTVLMAGLETLIIYDFITPSQFITIGGNQLPKDIVWREPLIICSSN